MSISFSETSSISSGLASSNSSSVSGFLASASICFASTSLFPSTPRLRFSISGILSSATGIGSSFASASTPGRGDVEDTGGNGEDEGTGVDEQAGDDAPGDVGGRELVLERAGDLFSSEGTGDMGGDIKYSGLGAGAGLELDGTTICLGLSGLSLRITKGLAGMSLSPDFSFKPRNPITFGTERRETPNPLEPNPLTNGEIPLLCPLVPFIGVWPLRSPLESLVMGMIRSELLDTGVVSGLDVYLLPGVEYDGLGLHVGRVLVGEVGVDSNWIGIILSFPCSSGINT